MADILKEIGANVDESIDEALKKVPKRASAKLKSVSPKGRGEYAKGWRTKRIDDKTVVVYNAALPAMILPRANGGEVVLGVVQSCAGVATLVGSLIVTLMPAPKAPPRIA